MQAGTSQASRRRHFRLETALTPCVLVMGEDPPRKGHAADIGGGGLRYVGPGRADGPEPAIAATGTVEFDLIGEHFAFPVTLVRRVETEDRCELALAWPAAAPREVDRLMYCLYKIETGRRTAQPARAPARPEAAGAPAWRRDWLLVAALGIACGALLPTHLVLPTVLIAALLAAWLITAPR